MVMIGDNAEPLADWQMPRRCCGEWADDLDCRICGHVAKPAALVPIADDLFDGIGDN